LNERFNLPNYNLESFSYNEQESSLPEIKETLLITASNYANVTGKRLFITPNILNKSNRKLTADESRKYA
jgi:hypothetical protein